MATDPYRYFRIEARELLEQLSQGLLELERSATPELLARLLRLAHTLKGAARVVKQPAIAERTHALEGSLTQLRERGGEPAAEQVSQLLAMVDAISDLLAGLDGPKPAEATAAPRAPAAPAAEEPLRTMRADVSELDALLEGLSEASVQLRSLRAAVGSLAALRQLSELLVEQVGAPGVRPKARRDSGASARSSAEELRRLSERLERELSGRADQAERELAQARGAAERLRLIPATMLLAPLERTVRDVAEALGKRARLSLQGGDVRLDAHVLGQVQAALVQAVRNAVAHGIENARDRAQRQKPALGQVEVRIARRGNRVVFMCRDDGAGIDVEAVRRSARRAGVSGAEALAEPELLQLLLRGGLTTSRTVTELSGRGVGLDVVRETAASLGGEVRVHSEAGQGTSLELVVPVSLSSLDALVVEANGIPAAIPLGAVKCAVRVAPGDLTRTPEGEAIVHEGRVVPFLPLARSLQAKAPHGRTNRAWSAVIVAGATALAAFGVDRLHGAANVVVRALPALAPADPIVAGASLDAEGMPRLVLDPDALVASALRAVPLPEAPPERARKAPILVIDDSLTTRMLEQSILESAGYEVELATSAEQALEKAARQRYGLFLVDVEMPGMDGFTFVERTRADPEQRGVPAILVSSRDAPEDLARGRAAGAHAYVVKADFDQGRLLETIRGLLS